MILDYFGEAFGLKMPHSGVLPNNVQDNADLNGGVVIDCLIISLSVKLLNYGLLEILT